MATTSNSNSSPSAIDSQQQRPSSSTSTRQSTRQSTHQSLTSFGFLDDSNGGQPSENGLGLGSLFNRVKSAFVAPITTTNVTPSNPNPNPTTSNSIPHSPASINHIKSNHPSPLNSNHFKDTSGNTSGNGLNLTSTSTSPATPINTSRNHQDAIDSFDVGEASMVRGIGNGNKERDNSGMMRSISGNVIMDQSNARISSTSPTRSRNNTSNNDDSILQTSSSAKPNPQRERPREREKDRSLNSLLTSKPTTYSSTSPLNPLLKSNQKAPPMALRSLAPTPSFTFTTSTHATAQRHFNLTSDDLSSLNGMEDLDSHSHPQHYPDPQSSSFNNNNINGGGGVGNWSSVPGFPLSKELLADDSRSIHSVSSYRRPRSDSNPNLFTTGGLGFGNGNGNDEDVPSAAKAGLQTSADAIYKRLRGEGMSRKFWMADESVRECRECLNPFGAFRRKHHCRVCGQIFCSRCASNIIPGGRFGHDGVVRVCNFCSKMLADYEREERSAGFSRRNRGQGNHQSRNNQTTTTATTKVNGRLLPGMISEPLEAQVRSPLSQFAANHLFPRTGAGATLGGGVGSYPSFATGLAALASRDDLDVINSRPETPDALLEEEEMIDSARRDGNVGGDKLSSSNPTDHHDGPAPFRKYVAEEDSTPVNGNGEEEETPFATEDEIIDPNQPDPNHQGVNGSQGIASPPQSTVDSGSGSGGGVPFPSKGGPDSPHDTHRGARFTVDDQRSRLVSDAALRALRHSRLKSRPGGLADLAKAVAAGVGNGDDSFNNLTQSRRDSLLGGFYGSSYYGHSGIPGSLGSELSPASLSHLTKMLSQTLDRAEVPRRELWTSILIPLVVRAVQQVRPNPRRGEAIDIRHYIKIKRNPGGSPSDCKFVDGFVLSKHVATKKMARNLPLHNARILVLTFSLDYFRDVEQYVSLESLIAQEHEYTRILVARITALRPHIVVTEKTVSRLALDMLEEAGIVVVLNVKPSAIEAISRCTQADIVSSIDRLSLEPRLGRCITFDVENFEHVTQVDKRKNLMRFSGPAKDLGCTILVRGGNAGLLHRIKAIVALAVFVGYNLRLEEHLMRDEGASLVFETPQDQHEGRKPEDLSLQSLVSDSEKLKVPNLSPKLEASPKLDENAEFLKFKEKVADSLEPYSTMLLSASASVRLPPPYPLAKMKEEGEKLLRLKERDEAEETARIIRDERKEVESSSSSILNDSEKMMSISPPSNLDGKLKENLEKESESEKVSLSSLSRLETDMSRSASSETTPIPTPTASTHQQQSQHHHHQPATVSHLGGRDQDLSSILREPSEVARESEYHLAQARYSEHLKEWQAYLNRKEGEVSITPFAHQRLVMLSSKVCTATDKPCTGPALHQVEFYGYGDETLGQYLERTCDDATSICSAKNCDRQNIFHYQTYVHHQTRIQAVLERFVCPVPGEENRLLMWSYCKACQGATPISLVSQETWSLSYSKYLELHFYPGNVKPSQCQHDFFRDHVRYFAYKNLAIRFHSDAINTLEITVPSMQLFKRPEIENQLKNQEALALARKNTAYWDSVASRIKALGLEVNLVRDATSKEHAYTSVSEMIKMSEADRREMETMILKTYVQTAPTDVLSLNVARRALQDKVVQWDVNFVEFEKSLPTDKDVRRITTSHLKRLFAEREPAERVAEALGLPPSTELDEAVAEAKLEEPKQKAADVLSAAAPDLVAGAAAALAAKAHSVSTTNPSQTDPSVPSPSTSTPGFLPSALQEERETEESDTTSSSPRALHPPKPRTPSPTAFRNQRAIRNPADDQSSCTENESFSTSQVHSLVKRFDTPNRMGATALESESDSLALSKVGAIGSARRPGMRRGKTEEKVSTRNNLASGTTARGGKPALKAERVGNDSALSDDEAVKRVGGGSRSSSPSRGGQPQSQRGGDPKSRIPTRAPSSTNLRSASKVRETGNITTRRAAGPPSSYRPPKSLEVAPRPSSSARTPIGGRSISSTATSTPSKDRASARNSSRETSNRASGNLSRQTSSVNLKASQQTPSRLPAPTRVGSGTKSRVSTIARHFDRINREAEREREGHRQMMANRARRARPVAVTNARVEVFSSVKEAVKDESESSEDEDEAGNASHADAEDEGESDGDTSSKHTAKSPEPGQHSRMPSLQRAAAGDSEKVEVTDCKEITSQDGSGKVVCTVEPSSEMESDVNSGLSISQISATLPSYLRGSFSSDAESGATERKSLLNTLSGLFRGADSLPMLEYPLIATEHVFADSKVIIREDEPSSIIAFTLSSKTYTEQLRSMQASRAKSNDREDDLDIQSVGDGWGIVEMPDESADLESAMRRLEGTHVRFEYESGSTRFNCKVLFAEQFDALRKSCACQESLIESLARCVKWDSSGGKSGSAFLKTRDDRLVVKQLSRYEMDAFSSFAPHYFEYMSHCIYNDRPTTLAKIFGCFRIGYRNAQTGKQLKLDCLVTENLFHGREMTRIYDLKGSTRNRHMKETGKMNEVLLDENLVEQAYKDPLFVREHSKRLLRAALWNDSLFLSDMNVMDYSLVVGLDQNGKELVVGIIDFVRTYTWDKRVESFVKETTLLGGGGKGLTPTIITPVQYRGRFLAFLDRIFLMSPDTWLAEAWA